MRNSKKEAETHTPIVQPSTVEDPTVQGMRNAEDDMRADIVDAVEHPISTVYKGIEADRDALETPAVSNAIQKGTDAVVNLGQGLDRGISRVADAYVNWTREGKEMNSSEVKEILTKAAAEKVELESRIEKLESDLSNTQTKASKASKTYKKMRESFVKVAKALRNRVVAESKKAADVSAKLEGTAALSKEEAVALRTKILQLEAAQNRTVERTAAICTELRDLVKKAQFEGARKGFAAKQATEKAEKLTAEVEQLKQENNERVVRMFAENTLYSLGEESNPKLKKLLESCTTLEEVQEVRDKFEELHKVMEESLPIEGINTRYLAEEVESALGKSTLSSDPETARLEKMFLNSVK